MNRVFLSHSSKDKSIYLKTVAQKLGKENIEFDEWTFEEGETTALEIEKRLDSSSLFAFFISENSLTSKWVKDEAERAISQLDAGKIRKIFPIIIDPSITHKDSRIPKFLRDNYNLKYISRPTIAARRIQSKLRELQWASNPKFKARQSIFVGRNELLNNFENRIDNIDLQKPACIIASGLPRIGRSSLLSRSLLKANITNETFKPIKIFLDRVDSIEDLIIKLFDTGLTSAATPDVSGLIDKTLPTKEALLSRLFKDIQDAKEIIFIEDAGCLVTHEREVAPWLVRTLADGKLAKNPVICISAKYRINPGSIRRFAEIYAFDVPELAPPERNGLLKRLLELHEISVTPDDFNYFATQLHGYPEEVDFCADLISDFGVLKAKEKTHEITEFNAERASIYLRSYDQNQKALDFIYFLSRFEFISVSFIFEIVDESEYGSLLEELVTHLVCDYIGIEREFVRINDTIRDLVQRNRLELPEVFKSKLRTHVKQFVQDTDKFERDSADFLYSVKEAIAHGEKIDESYLIPSHVLRTIRELYYARENLSRVVKLADMLLQKESSLDLKVSQDIRYYLCLSLARQKDKRVMQEAMKIHGPEHDFVLGYYYRVSGRHADAIERLSKIVSTPYIASRAKRELVQVYLYIEEFNKALVMARENYEANRGNQYPIQSYLHCLLNTENLTQNIAEIERLISELEQIGSSQSKEMSLIAKGLLLAKQNGNKTQSYNYIDDAIALGLGAPFPYFAKFDIALKFKDVEMMSTVLGHLERLSESRTFSKNTIVKNRAYYLAATNKLEDAEKLISTGLENYPRETIEKIKAKLKNISSVTS